MDATKKLVDFVSSKQYEDLSETSINTAKGCILDCIGVSLIGSIQPVAKILVSYLEDVGGNTQSTLIGLRERTSPVNAALVNGTLGHAIDYDDHTLISIAHPTVTILPAVLALGESNNVTGKDAILAFLLGYEVFAKIAKALNPNLWYRGFHATGFFGTYGAVAASSKLLNLDKKKMTNAFGIAGSEASGLKQNFGTMTKPLHAGLAAEGGVKAALLAKSGFTSAKDVLEGRHGFAKVLADVEDLAVLDKLGDPWEIVDSGSVDLSPLIKPYPSAGGTHAAMHTLLSLIKEYNIKPEEVEHIDAGMNLGGVNQLPYTAPVNSLQAKFSMQFCLAIILLERKAGLNQFTDSKVREAGTIEMMKRITATVDPELSEMLPLELCDKTAKIKIKMKDGRKYERTGDIPHLNWEEIKVKYSECASFVQSEREIRQNIDAVENLENLENLNILLKLLGSKE